MFREKCRAPGYKLIYGARFHLYARKYCATVNWKILKSSNFAYACNEFFSSFFLQTRISFRIYFFYASERVAARFNLYFARLRHTFSRIKYIYIYFLISCLVSFVSRRNRASVLRVIIQFISAAKIWVKNDPTHI